MEVAIMPISYISLRVQSQFSFVCQFSLSFAVLQFGNFAVPDRLLRRHLHLGSAVRVQCPGASHARTVSVIHRVWILTGRYLPKKHLSSRLHHLDHRRTPLPTLTIGHQNRVFPQRPQYRICRWADIALLERSSPRIVLVSLLER